MSPSDRLHSEGTSVPKKAKSSWQTLAEQLGIAPAAPETPPETASTPLAPAPDTGAQRSSTGEPTVPSGASGLSGAARSGADDGGPSAGQSSDGGFSSSPDGGLAPESSPHVAPAASSGPRIYPSGKTKPAGKGKPNWNALAQFLGLRVPTERIEIASGPQPATPTETFQGFRPPQHEPVPPPEPESAPVSEEPVSAELPRSDARDASEPDARTRTESEPRNPREPWGSAPRGKRGGPRGQDRGRDTRRTSREPSDDSFEAGERTVRGDAEPDWRRHADDAFEIGPAPERDRADEREPGDVERDDGTRSELADSDASDGGRKRRRRRRRGRRGGRAGEGETTRDARDATSPSEDNEFDGDTARRAQRRAPIDSIDADVFESVGSDVEPSEDDDVASDESRDFAYGGFGKGRDARGGRKAERRTPEPFDSEDDSEIASDLDDDSEHDDEVRPKHTKIPTWEQAVRVIIETNTANRAKSTPHANRGRGRRR